MSDMYFDPSEFDFTSLADIVEREPVKSNDKAFDSDSNQYGGVVDDISDLIGSPSNRPTHTEEVNEEETEPDYNADLSDLESDPEEDFNSVTDYFNAAPDDAVLVIGERSASKAELAEILAKREEIEESHKAIAYDAQQFKAGNEFLLDNLNRLSTSAERQIKHIDEALKNNPSDKDYRYLMQRRYEEKAELQRLNQFAEEAKRIRFEQEGIALANHVQSTDNQMLRMAPNWYDIKGQLLNYLVENGVLKNLNDEMEAREFNKTYTPTNIKIWMKAMKADQNLKYVAEKAKAAKAKAPRSTSSAVNTNRESAQNPNIQASKAIKNMGASRQANVNAFAFLKD